MHDFTLFIYNHIEAITGLVIGAAGVAFSMLKGSKVVGIIKQSQAATAFLLFIEKVAENVAHELQGLADQYRAEWDRAEAKFKAGGDPSEWAAAQVAYDKNMAGLKNLGVQMIWNQVGDLAPEWMKNTYTHIGPILEKVLALTREARGIFSARSSTPEVPATGQGESK